MTILPMSGSNSFLNEPPLGADPSLTVFAPGGQQSFEELLQELASGKRNSATFAFATTGTLGIERLEASDQPVSTFAGEREQPSHVAPASPLAALQSFTAQSFDSQSAHPSLIRLVDWGRPQPSTDLAGSSVQTSVANLDGRAIPPAMLTSPLASRTVPRGSQQHRPNTIGQEKSDGPSPGNDQVANASSAPSIQISLQSTDGIRRAIIGITAPSIEDLAELRQRARQVLAAYGWADADLEFVDRSYTDHPPRIKDSVDGC